MVGFDKKTHSKALHYQTTSTPTKILNVVEKDSQLLVSETSTLSPASSSDLTFQKAVSVNESGTSCSDFNVAVNVKLKDVATLFKNQKVNITGVITVGEKPPKHITKRNGELGFVKEDCVVEDETGYSEISIWEESTKLVKKWTVVQHKQSCYKVFL